MSHPAWLLAQTTQPATPTPGAPAAPPQADPFSFFLPLMLAIVVFYFFIFRGQRKDRQKHDQMLRDLKKNDRVQTIGGILGTVVEVREQEVVLKVDESNNVKIRFNRGAVKEVISTAAADGKN